MNKKTKRRMVVVTGIIIIVLIIVLAVVGGTSSAKAVTISDMAATNYEGQKVQVSGTVVDNSYAVDGNTLSFQIYDPDGDITKTVNVSYDGGVSATFGNGVVAICTGKLENGVLKCSELVTKCPSKYENATDALSVDKLVGYGSDIVDKTLKVTGKVVTLNAATASQRLVIMDDGGTNKLSVKYQGALSDDVKEGSSVVITGSLGSDGTFSATDVALGK